MTVMANMVSLQRWDQQPWHRSNQSHQQTLPVVIWNNAHDDARYKRVMISSTRNLIWLV